LPKSFQTADEAHVAYINPNKYIQFFGPKISLEVFGFEEGLIIEHYVTIETILAMSEWKNKNDKF
jgi:hypothetical protein